MSFSARLYEAKISVYQSEAKTSVDFSTKITHEQTAFILMLLWLRYAEINRQLQEHHHNTHLIYQHQRIFRFGFLQTLNYLSRHCSNICPSGYTHMQFLQ